ncbi:MAG: hypothetical protein HY059_06200 [Proteobacteria bacterium]|nr:hypothetical protein [Pseudomonadota bacterium]
MVMLIGPCFFLAPVVAVLAVLAIPLWPVCLAVLFAMFVVVWPVEQVVTRLGVTRMRGASARVWGWLLWMSTPWNWFDLPKKAPPAVPPAAPPAVPPHGGDGPTPS